MTYGARLRELRAERQLSLREVEERGGPNKDTMSLIERGVHKPQPQTLGRIAKALGVGVAELRSDLEAAEYPLASAPPSQEKLFNNGLEEERREGRTVQDVRETYLPFREGLEDYCARWERLLEGAKPLARGEVEEFVYAAEDLSHFLLAARASELRSLGEALLSAGEPFSAEKLQDLSLLKPAFRRYYALMHALVERLPKEEAEEVRPRLRLIQGEMTA